VGQAADLLSTPGRRLTDTQRILQHQEGLMIDWKFSANAAFFGLQRDRFTQYQPQRTLEDKIEQVSRVEGLTGIELKHPVDLQDPGRVKQLLEKHELLLSAVNVDIKDAAYFRYGALSASSAEARQHAITLLREAMDIAADLGTDLVTTCPLADGYDYPFQVDYVSAWGRYVETVQAVATYRSDIRVCLEYQPHEPHARILLRNVGTLLHLYSEVGAPNLGANLDIGHSLAAGESPAEAAALLHSKGRLFYIHTNDNTGDGGDWDMISGTVHFWHWLELLYTLDIVSKHTQPVAAFSANLRMVQRMSAWLERIGTDKITDLIQEDGNIAETFDFLSTHLLPDRPQGA
jgi:xylose isomerase